MLSFELITPDGVLLEEKVSEIIAVTETGEIGILSNHADLKSILRSAPMKYKNLSGTYDYIAVLGGIIEVAKNKVTVLTDFAEKGADINETEAHKAADKARAELQTLDPDASRTDTQLLIAETQLQRELLRLQTAQLRSRS